MIEDKRQDLGDNTLLGDKVQGFQLTNPMGNGSVEVLAEQDTNKDYPVLLFNLVDTAGVSTKFALQRDEIAAITFALARQDQQHKLLDVRMKEYKEVLVRLMIQTNKDIKAGDYVVCWRKERVPVQHNYTHL